MKKKIKPLMVMLLILLPLSVIIHKYFSEKNFSFLKTSSENSWDPLLAENNPDFLDLKDNTEEANSKFKGTSEGLINATLLNFTIPITVKSTWRIKKTGQSYKCYLQVNIKNHKYNIDITKTTSCIGTTDIRNVITLKQPSFNLIARGSLAPKTASGTWTINPELLKEISYKGIPLTLRLKGSGRWSGRAIINNHSITEYKKNL